MKHEERLKLYGALANPPFRDRETYLTWTADWKRRYAELSIKIRAYKLHLRINQRMHSLGEATFKKQPLPPHFKKVWEAEYPEGYWADAWNWSEIARQTLRERHQAKVSAQQQWEVAQQLKAA